MPRCPRKHSRSFSLCRPYPVHAVRRPRRPTSRPRRPVASHRALPRSGAHVERRAPPRLAWALLPCRDDDVRPLRHRRRCGAPARTPTRAGGGVAHRRGRRWREPPTAAEATPSSGLGRQHRAALDVAFGAAARPPPRPSSPTRYPLPPELAPAGQAGRSPTGPRAIAWRHVQKHHHPQGPRTLPPPTRRSRPPLASTCARSAACRSSRPIQRPPSNGPSAKSPPPALSSPATPPAPPAAPSHAAAPATAGGPPGPDRDICSLTVICL